MKVGRSVTAISCFVVGTVGAVVPAERVAACSLAVFPCTAPSIRFSGKAVGHVLRIEQGFAATYDWTFVVSSWGHDSSGFRRRPGSRVTVSVVETPQQPPSTAPLPPGAVANSCSGIRLGITEVFRRNQVYDVIAVIHSGPPIEYLIGAMYGSMSRRER